MEPPKLKQLPKPKSLPEVDLDDKTQLAWDDLTDEVGAIRRWGGCFGVRQATDRSWLLRTCDADGPKLSDGEKRGLRYTLELENSRLREKFGGGGDEVLVALFPATMHQEVQLALQQALSRRGLEATVTLRYARLRLVQDRGFAVEADASSLEWEAVNQATKGTAEGGD